MTILMKLTFSIFLTFLTFLTVLTFLTILTILTLRMLKAPRTLGRFITAQCKPIELRVSDSIAFGQPEWSPLGELCSQDTSGGCPYKHKEARLNCRLSLK